VFAPLANRLGIWEIKWEMEDLGLSLSWSPKPTGKWPVCWTKSVAERESGVERLRAALGQRPASRSRVFAATVQGRPKHIYSIVKKMRGKSLDFEPGL
jgi:GTP pyrophosphokinase